ncbi:MULTISPECIES: hypothetical protein [unclassified Nocardioides]|uniref:hypothetical protein n=1 Tax=unclassified Nocardioides TaxID=2615069 RepID=UPI0009EF8CCC|nr:MULTISPECIES: hypothetical protein [unclassified Nocardioides]GAW49467.1 uncharacterized protein (Precursor) [Nocardioides sp. PD653-B2]GAW55019.1 uncharacterized protein (Precursor) [Nocardioides sp. PD653]
MQDWIVPVAAGVLALVALALGIALLGARSRTDRAVREARAETADLRAQLDALELRLSRPAAPRTPVDAEFVITHLGTDEAEELERPAPEVGSALFADLLLRETVVKAAALAHGVRRALDPETRNRIRFEMKREVKRARKQRRAETRRARREWEARRRSALDPTLGEEGTAA